MDQIRKIHSMAVNLLEISEDNIAWQLKTDQSKIRLRELAGEINKCLRMLDLPEVPSDQEVPADYDFVAQRKDAKQVIQVIICSLVCERSRECANHESAGDFRMQDGSAPFMIRQGSNFDCNRRTGNGTGALLDNGRHLF